MTGSVRRVLSLPLQALPGSLAASVANRFYDVARLLDARLRDKAIDALDGFRSRLVEETMSATSRFPRLGEHPDVRFALEDIGPSRVEAAKRYLAATDERDYNVLIEFLTGLAEGLRYDIVHAELEEDVGDSLLRSLDGLHDFLLAHRLVGPFYRVSQAMGEGFVFQVGELDESRARAFRLLGTSALARRHQWKPSRPDLAQMGHRKLTRNDEKRSVTVA
jgi:hypothetical protein